MNLKNLIAKLGTNLDFVAFNAHWGVVFAVLAFYPHMWLAIVLAAFAAWKEFYFDAKYEVPKQTFLNNLTDFTGYALGIALAIFRFKMHF